MDTNSSFFDQALTLKPLYAEMISAISDFYDQTLTPFFMQWGSLFPTEHNTGIMFYGRAVNGWVTNDLDVEKLFDRTSDSCIFALYDQMQWVDDCADGKEEYYNSNRSAFWRVIRKTAKHFYPENELSHICWSNVCKISPYRGNPNAALFYAQLPKAREIMQRELEIFSPKHVVLLTGRGWVQDFLYYLNGNKHTNSINTFKWGYRDEYCVKVYKIGHIYFYLSEHPQTKNEETHVDALIKAIENNCYD